MSGLERLTYTVAEAGAILGLSRGASYEAANRGELPVIRIGRRIVVPKAALERLLDSAAVKQAAVV
jgi:excisionase family DNA binding protein